jgi:PAS domain S-box-containing protein
LRDITHRRALEGEQARLSDTNRLLLDSTGEGVYGIDLQGNFTFVNRAAARMLGYTQEALAGRNGHALIHHTYPDGSPYPDHECPIFKAMRDGEAARVEDDVFWREDGTAFPVGYSAAPIIEMGVVRGAVVTFSDISARKELEREHILIAEREHRIAEQLQQALQPNLPEEVPGLELADYYRAALGEAEVGGDFSDVFATDKGVTYLVVGDLSGKGLAAASQVATVRNMLRYAVSQHHTLAGAIINLNMVLAEQGLLTGFATLFVGYYDAATRGLTYVNCGQDAALILRAETGETVPLETTGTVLGAVGGVYRENDPAQDRRCLGDLHGRADGGGADAKGASHGRGRRGASSATRNVRERARDHVESHGERRCLRAGRRPRRPVPFSRGCPLRYDQSQEFL